jgi:hypothetical protein
MGVELPAMIGALDVFSVEVAAVERHAPVRTGIAQGKGTAGAVASDYKRKLQQHGLVELVAMDMIGRQGAVPEGGEHEGIGRVALGRVEFGHGRSY